MIYVAHRAMDARVINYLREKGQGQRGQELLEASGAAYYSVLDRSLERLRAAGLITDVKRMVGGRWRHKFITTARGYFPSPIARVPREMYGGR